MPYGKIHESFFSSSIVETDLETRFVFIAMIVLSDKDGRLDITRQALARRINTPLEVVDRAIEILSAPDEMSRSAGHEGRRLLPIDSARSWGWIVVNKATYRHSSDDERREQARERKRRQRDGQRRARETPPQGSTADPDTDADTHPNTDTDGHGCHEVSHKKRDRNPTEHPQGYVEIVDRLKSEGIIKRGATPQLALIREWCVAPGAPRVLSLLAENRDRILSADKPFSYLTAIIRKDRESPARMRLTRQSSEGSKTASASKGEAPHDFDFHLRG